MLFPALFALTSMGADAGLTVSGPQLLAGGKPVRLKGVCIGDIMLSRQGRPLSDYSVIAKEWKANAVRIGVAPVTWNTKPHHEVMANLKSEVQAALKAGMFVVIDWHSIGWPDGYTQLSSGSTALYDSRIELGRSFWLAAAKAFGKDTRVVFQLWCEPVRSETDYENALGTSWRLLKPVWQDLTQLIRGSGAKNVLLQTGGRWAYDLKGVRESLMDDPNTAYHWHVYAGHDGNDPSKWAQALDDLQKVRPVIVSEWGFSPDTTGHFKGTAQSFGDKFVRFMDERGLHGLAWCWHNSWGPAMFTSDWSGPSVWGQFVQKWLKAKPQ